VYIADAEDDNEYENRMSLPELGTSFLLLKIAWMFLEGFSTNTQIWCRISERDTFFERAPEIPSDNAVAAEATH
jgi:hypothetical protein